MKNDSLLGIDIPRTQRAIIFPNQTLKRTNNTNENIAYGPKK